MNSFQFDDFRRLPHKLKIAVRKFVVTQFTLGYVPEALAMKFGIGTGTVESWVARFIAGGMGALDDRPGTGCSRILTEEHAQWIFHTVVDKNPRQFKFEFAYWTVQRVRRAFIDEFGIDASRCTIRRVMRRLRLTPQKPRFRAFQRRMGQVARWIDTTFPEIKQEAEWEGALIMFADEAGMRSEYHVQRTWVVRGQTPELTCTATKFRFNMLAEISPDGRIHYMLHEGTEDAGRFCSFVKKVAEETGRKVRFVVDICRIHTAREVASFLEKEFEYGHLRIHILPEYSPMLNPDELVRSHVKPMVSRKFFKTKHELLRLLEAEFKSLMDLTDKVARFFKEPDCKYILG